jgi:hypothetical protein
MLKPEGRGFDSWCYRSFFDWPDPSSRTVALGSTQPLTEMSTRNIPGWGGGKGRPARKADNFPTCMLRSCLPSLCLAIGLRDNIK